MSFHWLEKFCTYIFFFFFFISLTSRKGNKNLFLKRSRVDLALEILAKYSRRYVTDRIRDKYVSMSIRGTLFQRARRIMRYGQKKIASVKFYTRQKFTRCTAGGSASVMEFTYLRSGETLRACEWFISWVFTVSRGKRILSSGSLRLIFFYEEDRSRYLFQLHRV